MKRNTLDHPKTLALGRRLAASLGIDRAVGVHVATSILERLWQWAAKHAQTGSLDAYAVETIADCLAWPGDPGDLIAALIAERWVDERDGSRTVHDWPAHCEDSVHAALIRRGIRFADGTAPRGPSAGVVVLRSEIARRRGEVLRALEARDGSACRACASAGPFHVDHVRPLARGGDNSLANLQLLCPPCNMKKGARYNAGGA